MALEHRFACPLPNSLHARPATHLGAVASRYAADVTLVNERSGAEANAKSVLALISADIRAGDPLLLRVSGSGEEEAFAEMTRFLREDFAACDEPLPAAAPQTDEEPLPRSLRAAAPGRILRGAIFAGGWRRERWRGRKACDRRRRCCGGWRGRFPRRKNRRVSAGGGGGGPWGWRGKSPRRMREKREVLRVHAAMLTTCVCRKRGARAGRRGTVPLARAVLEAIRQFSEALHQSTSVYMRERVLDLQDLGARLLREIYGADAVVAGPVLEVPSIVVAESLTPGQFLALDGEHLRGLVLQHGGATSHTVILARAAGLPTLAGVEGATELPRASEAILDANLGRFIAGAE